MASIFGHAVVGLTITKLLSNKNSKLLLLFAIASTILPDVDVLAFNFGIPYEHPFGHLGFFAFLFVCYTLGYFINAHLW